MAKPLKTRVTPMQPYMDAHTPAHFSHTPAHFPEMAANKMREHRANQHNARA